MHYLERDIYSSVDKHYHIISFEASNHFSHPWDQSQIQDLGGGRKGSYYHHYHHCIHSWGRRKRCRSSYSSPSFPDGVQKACCSNAQGAPLLQRGCSISRRKKHLLGSFSLQGAATEQGVLPLPGLFPAG